MLYVPLTCLILSSDAFNPMLAVDCRTRRTQVHLHLLLVLHAVAFQVAAKPFLPFLSWDSFPPDSLAATVSSTSAAALHSASFIATRSSCPPFNTSSQIQLTSPLENQDVDCGGFQEYVYILNGSCSSDVFSMVIVTLQDNRAPLASVDVSLRAPLPLNSTTYASLSPNRRYYIMQLLNTCPGT